MNLYPIHNLFQESFDIFVQMDPQLRALHQLKYQFHPTWWQNLDFKPGIYILTGGRQVGKSTSCKLLIQHCLQNKIFAAKNTFYLPCDEIIDAKELSRIIRLFIAEVKTEKFLLVVDEVTFIPHWERTIKALADEGWFTQGFCLLTGSDTVILKEAAMSFPGRRGRSEIVDFHLYPLQFAEFVQLKLQTENPSLPELKNLFAEFMVSGGYLRAINDLAESNQIEPATFLMYEQWVRGDFLKKGKREDYLLNLLAALFKLGVCPISYSALTQKIGLMSKETCIDYLKLLERMDVTFELQAFDQNKRQGFPKKDRKMHFLDPFIMQTIYRWLVREGYLNTINFEANLVEAIVASHCARKGKVFYFQGKNEIDVITLRDKKVHALEVKWANQVRMQDVSQIQQFDHAMVLTKNSQPNECSGIKIVPVYQFLWNLK